LKENGPALGARTAAVAWLVTAVYYCYQYTLRSAPAVMMPQLSDAFGLSVAGVASMAGLFYYGYSPFSLVAGAAMDRLGPRRIVPLGAATVGVGALLFASGNRDAANVGRFLQGAGGVFALVGAAYIATTNFPASRAATLIGATQMFGMAGGSAGQFAVGPLIASGVSWRGFWAGMGILGLAISVLLFVLLPESPRTERRDDSLRGAAVALGQVFRNPQSILCGAIAGLLFIPTTIFDMIWGVRYLQDARGVDYATAVVRSATVPLGWIIGCPLLGWASDRIGRRKPVILAGAVVLLACFAVMLYAQTGALPPYLPGLVAGLASGAAMLPYTIIKEANPPAVSGTATGVVNFLNFTFSALLGPVFGWILAAISGGAATLEHYQTAFQPLMYGIGLAIVLTFFLKETGSAVQRLVPAAGHTP
jgi:MFS family permease